MLAINGRIFEFAITGVGRFCTEVIKCIDDMDFGKDVILLVSARAKNIPDLKNIKVRKIGRHSGIIWEQFELPVYLIAHHLVCINMSNSAPIIKPDYIVIHDIQLKVYKKKLDGLKKRVKICWPLLQYRIYAKLAKHIFTDSQFQKNEIQREYHVESDRITVVYCGWQHMKNIVDSGYTVLERYSIKPGEFFFAMATRAQNKNFKWIYKVAQSHPNEVFVVAGLSSAKHLADDIPLEEVCNIYLVGYVTDEDAKALMRYCKAFLYPSFYEGFGLPPLEALSIGSKIIISNTSCLPEIFGGAACYIDPCDYSIDLNEIVAKNVLPCSDILNQYSWKNTANNIVDMIKERPDNECG